jgi:hypothetical protein
VPAVTVLPSESITFANCLASVSVGNPLVSLAAFLGFPFFVVVAETYQRLIVSLGKVVTADCWDQIECLCNAMDHDLSQKSGGL